VKTTTRLQLVSMSRKRRSINPLPHTPLWHSDYPVRHRETFTISPFKIAFYFIGIVLK
jgi:hypothetical protein